MKNGYIGYLIYASAQFPKTRSLTTKSYCTAGRQVIGYDIHILDYLFPTNKIYLAHVICFVDGERKGPGAMQNGILLNRISALEKPNNETLIPRDQLGVPVTRIATVHLKAKLEWFSQQKSNNVEEHSFRNDQLCMLVLGCYIITNIPQNLENLLFYKQEQICHS